MVESYCQLGGFGKLKMFENTNKIVARNGDSPEIAGIPHVNI